MGGRGTKSGLSRQKGWEEYVGGELKNTVTIDGIKIEPGTHSVDRLKERDIDPIDIKDALTSPLKITDVKTDKGRPSKQYIGEKATAVVNPNTGKLITVFPTHTNLKKKLKGDKDEK